MTKARSYFRTFIFITLCLSGAQAQQAATGARTEADKALREKALELLESLAGQLGILQSPENRARLGANIADSLWERDERRARTLLVSVQEDINAGLRNQTEDEMANSRRRMVFLQLRVNTVERIAKHDGELALAFFRATESPDAAPVSEHGFMGNTERALELRLARQIATNNPEVALNLARQSLAKGFSHDLMPLIRRLNRKHPEQAATLYSEVVAKIARANLLRDQNAFYFAQNLARSFQPPAVDESSFRELIRMFINIAAANGCDTKMTDDDQRRYFCYQIRPLLPLIARVDRARAATFGRLPEESTNSGYGSSAHEELRDLTDDGSVDEVLALTAKYPHMAGEIYWSAINKALASGERERARKLANEFGGHPQMKRSLLEMIDNAEKRSAQSLEFLKDLQAKLDTIPRVELKVAFLLRSASAVAPADREEAEKLRSQANALIDTMKPGKDQLQFQMGLALVYCSENDDRGIALMTSIVPKLNELVSAAAKLDGYENHHLRDGEWNMDNEGVLGWALTSLAQNASYFAWCDFDRAVAGAGQFERPEIRLMAQVKLAQGILAGRPKPIQ